MIFERSLSKRLQGVLSTSECRELIRLCLDHLFVERGGICFVFCLISAFGDEEIGLAKLSILHFFVGRLRNEIHEILFRHFASQKQDQSVDPVALLFGFVGAGGGN